MAGTRIEKEAGPRSIRSPIASSRSGPPRVWFATTRYCGTTGARESGAGATGRADGRAITKKATREPATPTSITQIIGAAVSAPPELANGADTAIATAWTTPRTAEAAPAICGASPAARALALPKMNAWTAINTKKPAQVDTNGVPKANTPTARVATATLARVRPKPIRVRGRNRPTILAFRTDSSTCDNAVAA